MNILPKKRWHVRTKENIARVRRDEAEAAELEREKERRAKLAEQESRTALLRKRAKDSNLSGSINAEEVCESVGPELKSKSEADIYTASGNINFFKEIEAGIKNSGVNKEHEEEKKEEIEGYEKKIGLLTYLGQDTLESTGKIAWYAEESSSLSKLGKFLNATLEDTAEVGLKSKVNIDPLKDILKYTDTKLYHTDMTTANVQNNTSSTADIGLHRKSKNLCRKDKRHKKRSKHKKHKRSESPVRSSHKKKKRHRNKSSECSEEEKNKEGKLAKLREKRLKREAVERKRQERLLAGKDPDAEDTNPANSAPFKQKYNSQFNPHLAKQNQELGLTQPNVLQSGVKYWLQ